MGDNFRTRMREWEDTKVRALSFEDPDVSIKYKLSNDHVFNTNRHDSTQYVVLPGDTLDVAYKYSLCDQCKPLVLNMADDCFPGGNVALGSGAQEESIFRRTNISRTLDIRSLYPIKSDEAIYSARVTVFKQSEKQNFALYEHPFKVDFVSCPGLRKPHLTDTGHLTEEQFIMLTRKIELICQIADVNGHDVLVMGALGCGAWGNPPHDVARAFKQVLDKIKGSFRIVAFAILPDAEKGYITRLDHQRPSNIDAFRLVFAEDNEKRR